MKTVWRPQELACLLFAARQLVCLARRWQANHAAKATKTLVERPAVRRPSYKKNKRNTERHREVNCRYHTHLHSFEVASTASSVVSFSCSYKMPQGISDLGLPQLSAAATTSGLPAPLRSFRCVFPFFPLSTSCSRSASFPRFHLLELLLQFFFLIFNNSVRWRFPSGLALLFSVSKLYFTVTLRPTSRKTDLFLSVGSNPQL